LEKHLHIICHDVPYPPDYGGVFDLFYKIKTLHQMGIFIHLHCFEYGRGRPPELNSFCVAVNYYTRKQGHKGISHTLPYIVCSRSNADLLENLLGDDYPILIEGVHCSFLLNDDRFSGRKILLRLYNIEHLYYRQLFRASSSLIKKIYYLHESNNLKRYERNIANKVILIPFTEKDAGFYKEQFGARQIHCLPAFLPFQCIRTQEGTGCYCLYHGNLSVPENEKAATWLLKKVFNDLSLPVVIAGKNPSPRLERIVARHPYACLIANPSDEEILDVIGKAQVHVLPSFNSTGIKLKLLNALFNGRHCVVNEAAVNGTGLEEICHVCHDGDSFQKTISGIYNRPFSKQEREERSQLLCRIYDNEKNGEKLIQWIW
jgi:Glycosyl transferases group 1